MLYREKKPVVIEAFQMTKDRIRDNTDWPDWLIEAWRKGVSEVGNLSMFEGNLRILTLEGFIFVSPDDWIIKGIAGELHPCKPAIFAETYEPIGQ